MGQPIAYAWTMLYNAKHCPNRFEDPYYALMLCVVVVTLFVLFSKNKRATT